MTTVSTQNPVRSDLAATTADVQDRTPPRRLWALAGIGAGLAGAGTIVTSTLVDVIYRDEFAATTDGFAKELDEKSGVLFVFHSITALSAALLLVFAAGLHRRLRSSLTDSTVPTVALLGLAGTAVVTIMGAGLDTEFMVPFNGDSQVVSDSSAAMYNHWIGTIPWYWILAGLAGLAVFSAYRQGAVPRWIGLVGLVLGGLTLLLGISPLEYLSGVSGVLWLLVTALGFSLGDRSFREASRAGR